MPRADVASLDDYRNRRERRLAVARALHAADLHRAPLLEELRIAIEVAGADWAAIVRLDIVFPDVPHPYLVLDVARDAPLRTFPNDDLWGLASGGSPATRDLPDLGASFDRPEWDPSRSVWAASLGSNGLDAWFLVVDGRTPRVALSEEETAEFPLLGGRCARVVLHLDRRGLATGCAEPEGGSESLAGRPALLDYEFEGDGVEDE